MIIPSAIIRTNRRSLSLTISKDGELVVRAPKKLSLEYIYSFIAQKERWIKNKQNLINSGNVSNNSLLTEQEYMFLGEIYNKIEIKKLKAIEISNGSILFPEGLSELSRHNMVLKFYMKYSKEIISKRVAYFSELMDVEFASIKLDNAKSKWGSCDIKANLKFNLRLAMLPHKVIDYLVIHELSHLLEFNHSKQFYKIIESIMPDYKVHKNKLKDLGFLLGLFR